MTHALRELPGDDRAKPNGWILTPAANLTQFLADEMTISSATHRALITMPSVPLLCEVAKAQLPDPTAMQAMIDSIGGDLPFISKEAASGFTTLFSHTAVATWGAVETSIEHLLVNHLMKVMDAEALVRNSVPSIKDRAVRCGSEKEARATARAWETALPQELNTPIKRAIHMFQAFGVEVTLSEKDERPLAELAEIRNVLLHRAGVVDERFIEKCPWRSEVVGDRVSVGYEAMGLYFDAVGGFTAALWEGVVKSPYITVVPSGTQE